ncbi:RES family NAD+ phosphorylase [Kaistella sp.]|uniref:RES family NAD+ phosphorylase n=1 Tax=Kaistella sp. TaxID=2782235 RepID=UPI003C429C51
MLVFRIAHKKYAKNLSVSGLSGRWNSNGKLVLYTSESVSLAFLENMIYRVGTGFNDDYKLMIIEIPEQNIEGIEIKKLSKNWRKIEHYDELQKMGDSWYDQQKRLVLRAPSSVIPEDYNLIINTTHIDFKKVKLIDILDYEPDERLEKLLKKYQ